jgi:hypothetical protein
MAAGYEDVFPMASVLLFAAVALLSGRFVH